MSIFKEHKSYADRSATDRKRHKHKIDRAIKEGIHNIVAEESIIGKDGKKKIRIPVRGIKEFQFVYGKNNKRVGSAQGKDVRKGQKINTGKRNKKSRKVFFIRFFRKERQNHHRYCLQYQKHLWD